MKPESLLAGVLLLSLGYCACGSGHRSNSAASAGLVREVNALLPAGAEDGAESSAEAAVCVPEECPELTLFDSRAPGCCRGGAGCGGRVQLASNSWACLAPGYDRSVHALQAALARHANEPSAPDPACPSATLDGTTLAGCCDGTGRCGLSTEPWTASAGKLGVEIPSACLPRSEAVQLFDAAEPDAGPPLGCGVGASG